MDSFYKYARYGPDRFIAEPNWVPDPDQFSFDPDQVVDDDDRAHAIIFIFNSELIGPLMSLGGGGGGGHELVKLQENQFMWIFQSS